MRILALCLFPGIAAADVAATSADPTPPHPPAPMLVASTPQDAAAPPARVATAPAATPTRPAVIGAPPIDAPPARSALAQRADRDAAAGRSYFGETALTTPKGKVVIDARLPLAPLVHGGLRFGVTDRIELGVHAMGATLFGDLGVVGGASLKAQLWRSDRVAVALGLMSYGGDDLLVVPHAEVTGCADASCLVALTGSVAVTAGPDVDGLPVLGGVGVAVGRRVQFVGEVDAYDEVGEQAYLGYAGVRLTSRSLAFDGGVAFAFDPGSCSGCEDETMAYPFIGVAIRP